MSYEWQRFSEKCWDKVRYMRSPCNDIFFIQLYTGTLCILCMEEDFQYFEKYICIYIYWIFCDFIALRYQTWFISFDQDFHEYYEKAHILLIIIHIILVGLLLTLALFLHHTTTVRKDGQTPADPAQARGKRPASSRWYCSCYSCRGRSICRSGILLLGINYV